MKNLTTLREAVLDDLPTLLDFEQNIVTAERPYAAHLKVGKIHYYDIARLIKGDDSHVIVAENEGRVIASGYAKIEHSKPYYQHDRHSYLGFMFVDPKYRRQGINQRLIQRLLAWSWDQGVRAVYLDVYAENAHAVGAYEKAGFSRNLIEMRLDMSTPPS